MSATPRRRPATLDPSWLQSASRSLQHPLTRALLVLTFTTGLVDAVSYLGLGRVFTANMTGNLVLLGFGIAGSGGLPVVAPLVSLVAFLVGAAGGGVLAKRLSDRHPAHVARALGLEVLLITVATIVAGTIGAEPDALSGDTVIALLAVAMGIRNATVRRLAVPDLTTTVLTMTLTGLAADSKLAGGWRRLGAQDRGRAGDARRSAGGRAAAQDEHRAAAGGGVGPGAGHVAGLRPGGEASRVGREVRQHSHLTLLCQGDRLGEQARLADPGIAAQHQRRTRALDVVEEPGQDLDLRSAAKERPPILLQRQHRGHRAMRKSPAAIRHTPRSMAARGMACSCYAPLESTDVDATAVRISSATAARWESAIECEASTSIVVAPIRLAMWRSPSGGIALSPVATSVPGGQRLPRRRGGALLEDRGEGALLDGQHPDVVLRQVGRERLSVELGAIVSSVAVVPSPTGYSPSQDRAEDGRVSELAVDLAERLTLVEHECGDVDQANRVGVLAPATEITAPRTNGRRAAPDRRLG